MREPASCNRCEDVECLVQSPSLPTALILMAPMASGLASPHFLACLLSRLHPDSSHVVPLHAQAPHPAYPLPLQPPRALRKLFILQSLSQCHFLHNFLDLLLLPACPSPPPPLPLSHRFPLPSELGFPRVASFCLVWYPFGPSS